MIVNSVHPKLIYFKKLAVLWSLTLLNQMYIVWQLFLFYFLAKRN